MAKKNNSAPEIVATLRAAALALPEVEEAIACKGTALECASFKVRGKSFLFAGQKDWKVKLVESQKEALAKPASCKVGAQGWVTIANGDALPTAVVKRWIGESYRIMAGAAKKKKAARSQRPSS